VTLEEPQTGLAAVARRALDQACEVAHPVRLSGGASAETWKFDLLTPAGARPCILRRSATSERNRFATSVSKALEAQLQRLARAQGVPCAEILFELDPQDGLGEGYVMSRVAGETLAPKILSRPELETARTTLAAQCGSILAALHSVDVSSLAAQMPDQSALPQLDQLETLYRSFEQPQPVFEYALRWLRERAPVNAQLQLVHGDFRNGNFVVDEHGMAAVLDWELAHRGDPAEDFGWLCVRSWRFSRPENPVGGFGSLQQLLDAYEQAGGTPVSLQRIRYWQAFGTLRWGIICLFQVFSHLRGEQQSVELAAIGRRVSETEFDLMELIS
jgi:aminoglycoside phosphotransferase (APT) family kinase protein